MDDFRRCEQPTAQGQCRNEAVSGGKKCTHHGGMVELRGQVSQSLRIYQTSRFKTRLQTLAYNPDLKSLNEELGLLRLMIEARLNSCQDDMDLILQSAPIADLIMKAGTLVASIHKAELASGYLMDKAQINQFMEQVFQIVVDVATPEVADRIAARLLEVAQSQTPALEKIN